MENTRIHPRLASRLSDLAAFYCGRSVTVLGGDGFLGSHTTRALISLGAKVRILSRRRESRHHPDHCEVFRGDLAQRDLLRECFRGQEIIFDLAGSSGGVQSNQDPHQNLVHDCAPHLQAFQVAASLPTPPLLVFCSTRTVYGAVQALPVSETHPLSPLSMYAGHKASLENYLRVFEQSHGLPSLIFRLSNPYGPHLEPTHKNYGVINQFIRKAYLGEPIALYGDGSQLRDYIFIDDVVETFLRAASQPENYHQTYNLGGPEPIQMKEAVALLRRQCPQARSHFVPWPPEYKSVETGDYLTDLTKLRREVGNTVCTPFAEGVKITLEYLQNRLRPSGSAKPRARRVSHPLHRSFWHGKRVLITGAGGFLGSHLSMRLTQRGAIVGAVHRRTLPSWLRDNSRVWRYQLDLNGNRSGISALFEQFQPDYVYHLASLPDGVETQVDICNRLQNNVHVTLDLLRASHDAAVQGFLLGGSCKVFGNGEVPHREESSTRPDSSYAATKLAAWHLCQVFFRSFDIAVVALRPTLIYGPGQGLNLFSYLAGRALSEQAEVILDGGQQTRDPLFIQDAVDAYLRAMERITDIAGRALPLGGGQEERVATLARDFFATTGSQVTVCDYPERLRRGEMMRSYCDNLQIQEALQWHPKTARPVAYQHVLAYHRAQQEGRQEEFMRDWFGDSFSWKKPEKNRETSALSGLSPSL